MYNIYSQVRKPPLNAPVHHIGPFPCAPKKHPKGSWVPNGFRLPNIQNEPSEETGQLPMPKGNWDNGGTCQYSPVSSKYGWNPPIFPFNPPFSPWISHFYRSSTGERMFFHTIFNDLCGTSSKNE